MMSGKLKTLFGRTFKIASVAAILIGLAFGIQPTAKLQTARNCHPDGWIASVREAYNSSKFWQLQTKALEKEVERLAQLVPNILIIKNNNNEQLKPILEEAGQELEKARQMSEKMYREFPQLRPSAEQLLADDMKRQADELQANQIVIDEYMRELHLRNLELAAEYQRCSAMLFPAAPKGEQAGESITTDQITHELINSWWDSPMLDATTRTLCETVEHVVEVHPTVGEKAFVAICSVNRSHAEGMSTSLIVRPKYKEAREFINVADGGYSIDSDDGHSIDSDDGHSIDRLKVVDIEHDGVSELVIDTGHMAQGFYSGSLLVVRVQGWQPRVLFEESIVNCSGNSWAAYIRHDNCSFGSPASAALEFEDLDGDGLLDLIETVTHYEGFEEVSMEEAIRLVDCMDCEVDLKVGKTVNRYLFKNGDFVKLKANWSPIWRARSSSN